MSQGSSQTAKRHRRLERGIYERATKAGCVYEFCYQDANGDTRWETARTLAQARKQRAARIAAVDRGELVLKRAKITFAELAETWFEAKAPRLRKRTSDYYRVTLDRVLLPRFDKTRLTSIDADAIATLTRDLEREGLHAIDPTLPVRPLGAASITNYLRPLRGVMALAARRKLIPANPFSVLTSDDRPRRPEKQPAHEWTTDEVDALLGAAARLARKPESRYDYTPLLRLVATLGLRLGEVLGLRWEDFDRNDGYLHVRRQWLRSNEYGPTKTPAGVRRIPLPPELRDELIALRLRSHYSNDDQPIFASQQGTPLGHRNLTRRGWEPARDLANLTGVSFHDLRHATASRLIDAGLDPVTVAAVLGHADANITLAVYAARFNRQQKDDAIRTALSAKKMQSSHPTPPPDKPQPETRKPAFLHGSASDGN